MFSRREQKEAILEEMSKMNPSSQKTYGELFKDTLEKETNLKNSGYKVVSIWESDWNKIAEGSEKD